MKAIRSLAVAAALAVPGLASGAGFADPLDVPAQPSTLASRTLLQGVARAGSRLVAVGSRGHVLVSTDAGASWRQATVPVSSDLTAVFFVDERRGWAVGHDGVILASADGGLNWTVQLEGRKANELLLAAMQRKAAARPDSAEAKALLAEAERFKEQGADKPFLDVWFADERNGYAVGAFNLVFRTRDGGANWDPVFDRTDNPKLLNLYAIGRAGSGLYIAGEGGLVLKLDAQTQRFRALDLPYKGSFFGLAGDDEAVLVYGLRGNAYRTGDGGKTWSKVETGLAASIVAGAALGKGGFVLVDAGGRIAVSGDAGRTFKVVPLPNPVPVAGITDAGDGRLALVGPRGATVAALPR